MKTDIRVFFSGQPGENARAGAQWQPSDPPAAWVPPRRDLRGMRLPQPIASTVRRYVLEEALNCRMPRNSARAVWERLVWLKTRGPPATSVVSFGLVLSR